jgi:hypothetical protein
MIINYQGAYMSKIKDDQKLQKCQQDEKTRVDKLLDLKEKRERNMWLLKGAIKLGEATGFALMFGLFGHNPSFYKTGVIISVSCILLDFFLHYRDWQNEKDLHHVLS